MGRVDNSLDSFQADARIFDIVAHSVGVAFEIRNREFSAGRAKGEIVLEKIKKAGTISKDKEAIQLLRKHNILSMATYVVGFGEEKTKDFYKSLKQLLSYDPDQVQLLYVTPHKWTPYFEDVKEKEIIFTSLIHGTWISRRVG